MNILLQNTKTLQFVGTEAGWTHLHQLARSFQRAPDALHFCCHGGAPNMVLLFEFADSRLNFSLPATDGLGNELDPFRCHET